MKPSFLLFIFLLNALISCQDDCDNGNFDYELNIKNETGYDLKVDFGYRVYAVLHTACREIDSSNLSANVKQNKTIKKHVRGSGFFEVINIYYDSAGIYYPKNIDRIPGGDNLTAYLVTINSDFEVIISPF